jgi:hypothetical protein
MEIGGITMGGENSTTTSGDYWTTTDNRVAQQHQLVLGVEVLRQGKAKQISGLGRLRLRTH